MALEIDSGLIKVCETYGKMITGLRHEGQNVLGARLLLTIAGCESNFGYQRDYVRAEAGYSPGGRYYKDSDMVQALYRKWGCLAAGSYGSFQILFVTARELGFTGHPIELQGDSTCAYWATQLITQRFQKRLKAETLKEVLDCYNSGWHKDQYVPSLYIEKGLRIYDELQDY